MDRKNSVSIPYFVYSSGEKNNADMDRDWGVKFASMSWGPPEFVQQIYRSIRSAFNLSADLKERPSKKTIGGIVLPLDGQEGYLCGLVLPYHDADSQGNRPNIALIGCKVDMNLLKNREFTPGQLLSAIVESAPLKTLGFRREDRHSMVKERPDTINIDYEILYGQPRGYLGLEKWPNPNEGFVCSPSGCLLLKEKKAKQNFSSTLANSSKNNVKSDKSRILSLIIGLAVILILIITASLSFSKCSGGKSVTGGTTTSSGENNSGQGGSTENDKEIFKIVESIKTTINNKLNDESKKVISYICFLEGQQRLNWREEDPIKNISLQHIGDGKILAQKKSFWFGNDDKQYVLLTKDCLESLFRNLGGKWILNWDISIDKYTKFVIRDTGKDVLKHWENQMKQFCQWASYNNWNDLYYIKDNPKLLLSTNMENGNDSDEIRYCSKNKLEDILAKKVKEYGTKPNLKDTHDKILNSMLFIAKTKHQDIYKLYRVEEDVYRYVLKKKIGYVGKKPVETEQVLEKIKSYLHEGNKLIISEKDFLLSILDNVESTKSHKTLSPEEIEKVASILAQKIADVFQKM